MGILSRLLGKPKTLGEVVYYQAKSKKWRWKVVNTNGRTVVNPIRNFPTQSAAQQSFYAVQNIMDSLPSS